VRRLVAALERRNSGNGAQLAVTGWAPLHFLNDMNIAPRQRLFGLGMRKPHYGRFIDGSAPVDFVEVISENFMFEGGRPLLTLGRVREHYPIALHGVSMSVGSALGIDRAYLAHLRSLVDRVDPLFVSDHLCWTGFEQFNSHDLLPLPYTEESLAVVAGNVSQAQDQLGRQLLIENPSSYVVFDHSTMTEWDFLSELCRLTGCGLLLDINNVFVSSKNHGFDPLQYIQSLRHCDVQQFHLAGHDDSGAILIDTHDREVPSDVWALYRLAAEIFPFAAAMIERDGEIPPLDSLLAELEHARQIVVGNILEAA
jgi:uncharacterized protein